MDWMVAGVLIIFSWTLGFGSGIGYAEVGQKKPKKPKARQGYMTFDQFVKLHKITNLPNEMYPYQLRYDNYDPELVERRLFGDTDNK